MKTFLAQLKKRVLGYKKTIIGEFDVLRCYVCMLLECIYIMFILWFIVLLQSNWWTLKYIKFAISTEIKIFSLFRMCFFSFILFVIQYFPSDITENEEQMALMNLSFLRQNPDFYRFELVFVWLYCGQRWWVWMTL